MHVTDDRLDPASAPADEAGLERRRRVRGRWVGRGFAVGIGLGFALTAVQLAWSGWHILPYSLVWNLIWMPAVCAAIAYNRCPVPRERVWSWRRLRLRTRTLMAVIAYVALLFGMGVSTRRLGTAARLYYGKYSSSQGLAKIFREHSLKSAVEARQRLENAATLRSGKIPEGLLTIQKDFLRSLDRTATPEYRAHRYEILANNEEAEGRRHGRNESGLRQLSVYYDAHAAKYDRARWRPWRPVAPDPPAPAKW